MGQGAWSLAVNCCTGGRVVPTLTHDDAKFWKDEGTSAYESAAKREKDRKP